MVMVQSRGFERRRDRRFTMKRTMFACLTAAAVLLALPGPASAKWVFGNGFSDVDVLLPNDANFGQACDTRIQGRAGSESASGPYSPITVRIYTGPAGSLDGSTVKHGGATDDHLLTPDGTDVAPLASVTTPALQVLNPSEPYPSDHSDTVVFAAAPFDVKLAAGAISAGSQIAVKKAGYDAFVTLAAVDCPTPPGAPSSQFVPGTALSSGHVGANLSLKQTWTAAPGSGISYNLIRSSTSGEFSSTATTTATQVMRNPAIKNQIQWGVQAINSSGQHSAFALGPRFTIEGHQETEFSYSSGWSNVSVSGSYGGTVKRTTAAGASATLTFTGREAALVMTTGSAYGSAKVLVDGTLVATVDNHTASGTQLRRIVVRKGFSAVGSHTIKVVNQATSSHPRTDLDGLVALR